MRPSILVRPRLFRIAAKAVGITVLITWVVYVALSEGAAGPGGPPARLGGDFPAFYGAGRMVLAGQGAHLYEPSAQRAAQRDILPGTQPGKYYMFAYPPFTAAGYAGLAWLPYRAAYAAHSAFMVLCLALGTWLLKPVYLHAKDWPEVVLLSLVVFPVFIGAFLGQNALLSYCLFGAATWAVQQQRFWLAGLISAGLLFKPQLLLPWLAVQGVSLRWKSVFGALGAAVALLAASYAIAGPNWPSDWWAWALEFQRRDAVLNGSKMVSWPSLWETTLGPGYVRTLLMWGPLVPLGAAVAYALYRVRDDIGVQLALAVPAMLFASPHALRYELALLLPTTLLIAESSCGAALCIAFLCAAAEYSREAGVVALAASAVFVLRTPRFRSAWGNGVRSEYVGQ